jgi:cold shock protein
MKTRCILSAVVVAIVLAGCGDNIVAVDSGTYEGTISKVNPAEEEIYVTIDGDRTLELYFTDQTELTKNDQTVPFTALQAGDRVSVQVSRQGNRVEPLTVNILE